MVSTYVSLILRTEWTTRASNIIFHAEVVLSLFRATFFFQKMNKTQNVQKKNLLTLNKDSLTSSEALILWDHSSSIQCN